MTAGRAWLRSWSRGAIVPAPANSAMRTYYKSLGRYAAALALASDLALLTLGGALKRKEMISARLGDVLSELYLLSAVLKRWEDEGRQDGDLPIVEFCMRSGLATIETRLDEIFLNFPNRVAAGFLRFMTLPFGKETHAPSDDLVRRCAVVLLEPGAARDRLTAAVYLGTAEGDDGVSRLERAYRLVIDAAEIEKKLRDAGIDDPLNGKEKEVISAAEAEQVRRARAAAAEAIEVDDFPADAFARSGKRQTGKRSMRSAAAKLRTAAGR